MQLTISGHQLDLTDSLQNYVSTKFEKLTQHFDKITNTHVILSLEKQVQKAEATMHVNGKDLFAEATHDDMYIAIDHLADKLDRQLIKHKEKMRSH